MRTRIEQLILDLRTAAAASGLTRRQIATKANLHVNTLRSFEPNAKPSTFTVWTPSIYTIMALENALGQWMPACHDALTDNSRDSDSHSCVEIT
jgi:hypothetical protein